MFPILQHTGYFLEAQYSSISDLAAVFLFVSNSFRYENPEEHWAVPVLIKTPETGAENNSQTSTGPLNKETRW